MGLRKVVKLLVVDEVDGQYDQIVSYSEMYHPEYRLECKLATCEAEAREIFSKWHPSVILLDLHLGSDSIQLLDYISRSGSTPVVATSESRQPDLEQTAESHGAVGYVPRGDDQEELEALLDYLASVSVQDEASH
jgi:CheY-like chemotaxis protein